MEEKYKLMILKDVLKFTRKSLSKEELKDFTRSALFQNKNYFTSAALLVKRGSITIDEMLNLDGIVPYCDTCKNIIKPDVVLYEEGLDDNIISKTISSISSSDLLIIGGTSLVVYPAASFINYFKGKNMVLINKSKTPNNQLNKNNTTETVETTKTEPIDTATYIPSSDFVAPVNQYSDEQTQKINKVMADADKALKRAEKYI